MSKLQYSIISLIISKKKKDMLNIFEYNQSYAIFNKTIKFK